jgi:hypothetical protein
MYLMSKNSFYYKKDAVVYYRMPASVGDYLKQNYRFRIGENNKLLSSLDKEYVKREFKIKNKGFIFIKLFFKKPYKAILWFFLYTLGYLKFLIRKQKDFDINKIWGEVKSTKS